MVLLSNEAFASTSLGGTTMSVHAMSSMTFSAIRSLKHLSNEPDCRLQADEYCNYYP